MRNSAAVPQCREVRNVITISVWSSTAIAPSSTAKLYWTKHKLRFHIHRYIPIYTSPMSSAHGKHRKHIKYNGRAII